MHMFYFSISIITALVQASILTLHCNRLVTSLPASIHTHLKPNPSSTLPSEFSLQNIISITLSHCLKLSSDSISSITQDKCFMIQFSQVIITEPQIQGLKAEPKLWKQTYLMKNPNSHVSWYPLQFAFTSIITLITWTFCSLKCLSNKV